MTKVAVVILNWNGKKLLEKFLPSVTSSLPEYAELIVADNKSSDNSINFLKEYYPSIRIIENSENFGFAQGYNEALKHVDAEYFVLLNSDIETPQNWIEPIIEFMDLHPDVGACQPKILAEAQKGSFEYAGASGGYIDYLGYPFCRGRIFNTLELDEQQYQENAEIFWATGACMFVRSSIYNELEGFDGDFFAHMEEIDLCWRIKRMGYKIFCIPSSYVFHVGGGTLDKINPRKTFLNFRNNLLMIVKNAPRKQYMYRVFLKLTMDGLAGVKFLLSGDVMHTISVVRAHFAVYGSLRKTLEKRKELLKKMPVEDVSIIYGHSIVKEYYFHGRKKFSELRLESMTSGKK